MENKNKLKMDKEKLEGKPLKLIKLKPIYFSDTAPINSKFSDYSVLKSALDQGKKDLVHILLNSNCRVNGDLNNPACTPLHRAIQLGDMEIFERLLAMGASLTVVDLVGNTPLHLAFILRRHKMVKSMLIAFCKYKVYSNLKNIMGLTYLHIACAQKGQLDIVQGFLDGGANINDSISKDSAYWPGYTAMHFAVKAHWAAAAAALVQADKRKACDKLSDSLMIDFIFRQQKCRDKYGHYKQLTHFHLACMEDNPRILERYIELVNYGILLNIPVSEEVTLCPLYFALHFAVEGNCKKNVEVLLKHGAMMDLCNSLKMTPLHLAFYHQRQEIVDLLWAKQKENFIINKKDFYLLSYLHMAAAKNEPEVAKMFCDEGEDVNARVLRNSKNFSHYSPLHFAVKFQHPEMVELLLSRGAKVNVCSGSVTPMHLAIETGSKDLIELLLRNGAKVDDTVRNAEGHTTLHSLVLKNAPETLDYAEEFVRLGCDVDAKDRSGNTALHFAEEPSYAKVLLELGADVNLENEKGKTPLMEARDWKATDCSSFDFLYAHVMKLKAIGAEVCPGNEREFERKSQLYAPDLYAPHERQMKNEIERMRNIRISVFTTLSEFLLMKPEAASDYVKEDSLKRIVEDKKLGEKFPMYGYLIKLQFRRATDRSKKDVGKRSLSIEILEEVKRRCCE